MIVQISYWEIVLPIFGTLLFAGLIGLVYAWWVVGQERLKTEKCIQEAEIARKKWMESDTEENEDADWWKKEQEDN